MGLPSWELPEAGAQVTIDGQLVTVVAVTPTVSGAELIFTRSDGSLDRASLDTADLAGAHVPVNDAGGHPERALTGLWGRWMQYAVPRIRSAVLATRPLRPFAHQDEAVFTHMLAQPRLRFLLADEPGTGKTIMTGMYLAEGTRRGLVPGRTVIVVPAHLVEKWRRDLRRLLRRSSADRLTAELARDPKDLDPRVDVWVVSRGPVHLQQRRPPQGRRRPRVLVARGVRRGAPADSDLAVPRRRPRASRPHPPPAAAHRHPAPRQGALLPRPAEPARPDALPLGPAADRLRHRAATQHPVVPAPDEGGPEGPRGHNRCSRPGTPRPSRSTLTGQRGGRLRGGHGLRRRLVRRERHPGPLDLRQARRLVARRGQSQPSAAARRRSGAGQRPHRRARRPTSSSAPTALDGESAVRGR